MMLLAANSQRQLGHIKEAQTLYRQIIQKYPAREEAKDARYQRLIGLYNANDPSLGAEIDEFLKENPERRARRPGEIAQGRGALQSEGFCRRRAALRRSARFEIVGQTARRSRFQTRLVFRADESSRRSDRGVHLFSPGVSRQSASRLPRSRSARSLTRKRNNIPARSSDLEHLLAQISRRRANAKPRCSKKRCSSARPTTPKEWARPFSSC